MHRRVGLLTLILAASFALPAAAQVRKRDHRKKRDPEVVKSRRGRGGGNKGTDPIKADGFRPRSGDAGTEVTITGKFDRKTTLLFGGKRLRTKKLQRAYITFVVPRNARHGEIVLRHPNMADDLVVGTFDIVANPIISSFAPAAGVPGTRVEIRGSGFRKGDQVLMNNRVLKVSSLAEKRIVATIPDNATTDYLIVSRPGGVQARSRRQFRVVKPAPTISRLSPESGATGTKVRIYGTNFTAKDKVFYGRWPVAVTGSSGTWIDFLVPDKARTDELVTVRNGSGTATSRTRFELERLPTISRFTPTYGVIGQRVEIHGDNFMPRDRVTLDGRPVRILQLRPNRISVEIPNRATSGRFEIERGRTRVASRDHFEVVHAPRVSGFTPSGGDEGTNVTITGSGFTRDAEVFYGRQELRVVRGSDSALVVQIPRRATDQFFTVRTRGGEDSTRTRFQVYTYSTVTGISPDQGTAGTRVRIRGRNFSRSDRFFLGRDELPIEKIGRDEVWVTIPEGARSAKLSWDSYGRRSMTRWVFTVLEPPVLADYGPHSGPAGTQVTINGDHFTRDTRVLWGNHDLRIVRRRVPDQLIAVIPNDARGTQHLWVVDAGARVRSRKPFAVVSPPQISGFSPDAGPPGSEVTLAGTDFSKATSVRLDRTPLQIVRWSPTSLVVRLPRDLRTGKGYFYVEEDRSSQRARTPFEVTGLAEITRFKPSRAKPGQRVELWGTNFSRSTKIYYGKYECEVVKVDKRGRKMQIILSPDASGKGYLWAEDYGEKTRSRDQLEVVGGAEKVPSRRGRKKRKHRRRRH